MYVHFSVMNLDALVLMVILTRCDSGAWQVKTLDIRGLSSETIILSFFRLVKKFIARFWYLFMVILMLWTLMIRTLADQNWPLILRYCDETLVSFFCVGRWVLFVYYVGLLYSPYCKNIHTQNLPLQLTLPLDL